MSIFNWLTSLNPIERITQALATIDTNHAQIHAKKAFSLRDEITVAQAQVGVIQITVPAGVYVHFQDSEFRTDGGPAYITMMKNAALTSEVGASILTPVNNHHIDSPVSSLVIKALANAGVTNGVGAKQIAKLPIYGSGAGAARIGGETESAQENVLDHVTYTFAFSHSVAGACKIGYKLFWYEEGGA